MLSEGVREVVMFVHSSLVLREFARGPLPSRVFSVDNALLFQYLQQVGQTGSGSLKPSFSLSLSPPPPPPPPPG